MSQLGLQISFLAPEIVLAVGAMIALITGLFSKTPLKATAICAVTLLVALFVLYGQTELPAGPIFLGQLDTTLLPQGLKAALLCVTIITLAIIGRTMAKHDVARFEFPVLMVLSVLGMFIMLSAHNWLMFYLGLELQSLAVYVLAAFARTNSRSTEAAAKYFILGALASGLILFGISYVYGATGSLTYGEPIAYADGFSVGMAFILAGVAFKLSLAPFHMWTPDVYDGVPLPVTAFLSLVPKIAALGALLQMLMWSFAPMASQAGIILLIVGLLSLAVGSFAGLRQNNIKRLLGYSTIGNIGTLVLGLAVLSDFGLIASLNYLFIYIILTALIFAGLMGLFKSDETPVTQIDDLAGLSKTHPFIAWSMAAALFGLAGIPPLAGFFAKFDVFRAVVGAGYTPVAVIAITFSVVSAAYYLRLLKVMFFDEVKEPLQEQECMARTGVMVVLLAALLLLVFMPDFILDFMAYLLPSAS